MEWYSETRKLVVWVRCVEPRFNGFRRKVERVQARDIRVNCQIDRCENQTGSWGVGYNNYGMLGFSDSDDCKEMNQTLNKIKWE